MAEVSRIWECQSESIRIDRIKKLANNICVHIINFWMRCFCYVFAAFKRTVEINVEVDQNELCFNCGREGYLARNCRNVAPYLLYKIKKLLANHMDNDSDKFWTIRANFRTWCFKQCENKIIVKAEPHHIPFLSIIESVPRIEVLSLNTSTIVQKSPLDRSQSLIAVIRYIEIS